ncbi:MAG: antibiotic biosynthesis monooxygenase [Novosphingobium sp.]
MYLVVFRNRKKKGLDVEAYEADAARMLALAREQPGFLSFKSYTAEDGEVVAISEWASEAAAHAWGSDPEHGEVQRRGREAYYENYTSFACVDPRVSRFEG